MAKYVPQIYDDIPDVGTPSSHVKVDVGTHAAAPPPPPPPPTAAAAAALPPPPVAVDTPTKPTFAFVPCLLVLSVTSFVA